MVLYGDSQRKHFDSDLLQCIKEKSNAEVLRILRNYLEEDFSLKDSSQSTLLHYAAKYGNTRIVQYLLDFKSEINAQNKQGKTPMMLAVQRGHKVVFEFLLKANANINLTDFEGKTAVQMIFDLDSMRLTMLEILFQHVTCQKILEGIGSDILAKKLNEANYTAVTALESKNVGLIKLLLDHKVISANARDPYFGNTLMHKAVQMKNIEIVQLLIEYKANVDALNYNKRTPLRYVYSISDHENESAKSLEVLKILISHAKLLTTSDDLGFMQICNVLEHGNDEAMKLILQSNIDLQATDEEGNTVLHWLARNCNVDHFTLLRGQKFDMNAQNKKGFTPLLSAVEKNASKAMTFLLKSGADVNIASKSGQTALHLLFERHLDKPITQSTRLLLEYGADPQIRVTNTFQNNQGRRTYTIFDLLIRHSIFEFRYPEHLLRAEPVIARLAIIEALGTEITEITSDKINLQQKWTEQFQACQVQVELMKTITIHGNVTLFQFLAESDKKVVAYVRNEELVYQLRKSIEEFEKDSPYPDLLRSRLERIIQLAELKDKATISLCRLINLKNSVIYSIAETIVGYLIGRDMENLVLAWNE